MDTPVDSIATSWSARIYIFHFRIPRKVFINSFPRKGSTFHNVYGSGGIAPPSLNSALDGGDRSASRPCSFIPEETASGIHCIGGWVGHRAGLDVSENTKICRPFLELKPDFSVVQSVVQSLYRLSYPGSLTDTVITGTVRARAHQGNWQPQRNGNFRELLPA
jgi:hypothetical protein